MEELPDRVGGWVMGSRGCWDVRAEGCLCCHSCGRCLPPLIVDKSPQCRLPAARPLSLPGTAVGGSVKVEVERGGQPLAHDVRVQDLHEGGWVLGAG